MVKAYICYEKLEIKSLIPIVVNHEEGIMLPGTTFTIVSLLLLEAIMSNEDCV